MSKRSFLRMTDAEFEQAVAKLAAGDLSQKAACVSAFRSRLVPGQDCRGTPAMGFMSEFDNPIPCYVLRAKYRNEILASAAARRPDGRA